MPKITRYEAEVQLERPDGSRVTYRGDGVGPDNETGDQVLSGAEKAALAEEPGARVVASRARRR
ncbi:hypothetical protein ADK70_12510 [Streptomyces rimosus subsp. pseudoverticillatus]|uniref:hypothetical protein n=1 Tax=Streptomyces rimosus TaxID=1927 RepID=UPI0006B2A0A1|nr:hypothetical protein [Streptomyces rimosus]KOT94495.1 hypothetical protein ADK70_12510 [Streptomyces rimosus subsp. pseudoverticillatus]